MKLSDHPPENVEFAKQVRRILCQKTFDRRSRVNGKPTKKLTNLRINKMSTIRARRDCITITIHDFRAYQIFANDPFIQLLKDTGRIHEYALLNRPIPSVSVKIKSKANPKVKVCELTPEYGKK